MLVTFTDHTQKQLTTAIANMEPDSASTSIYLLYKELIFNINKFETKTILVIPGFVTR